MRYKVKPPVFTLPAMGGPSPLWGREVPLFHTQNNTRNLSAGRSPQESPVIGWNIHCRRIRVQQSFGIGVVGCLFDHRQLSIPTVVPREHWRRTRAVGDTSRTRSLTTDRIIVVKWNIQSIIREVEIPTQVGGRMHPPSSRYRSSTSTAR
jgi:hypothetical protein